MKSDIDSLMQTRNLDALLILGPGQHNPAMVYLTGGAHLTDAVLVKKPSQPALLFHRSMERDEAAKTGLETRNLEAYNLEELFKQAGGDPLQVNLLRLQRVLQDAGLTTGRVAVYGKLEAGESFALLSAFQHAFPEITLVTEFYDSLLSAAMTSKDADEVSRIRRMGKITGAVVGQVADFLSSQRVHNQMLIKSNGEPLTIGEVKSRINLWLAERGAENPNGTIFAIGRDAGVPHSSGTLTAQLRLGQTIIFDIYPCEAGGGYFFDMTRTWCLGYATDEALALYEDVFTVYRQVMNGLRPGAPFRDYQKLACDIFEQRGHASLRSDYKTETGYVHGLGHGLGLRIHENPFARLTGPEEYLVSGVVFTVEPGLYYPEKGLGMRLEDTVWARPDGGFDILSEYPLDLVLPVK